MILKAKNICSFLLWSYKLLYKLTNIVTIKNKKTLNTVIIIPARIDSSRLKKKLLRNISGLPMIVRVAQNAENLKMGRVIVGTDSREIYNECEKNNLEVMMTKSSHKSGTDRVYEVYKILNKDFDLIINLQGDLPIFKKEWKNSWN